MIQVYISTTEAKNDGVSFQMYTGERIVNYHGVWSICMGDDMQKLCEEKWKTSEWINRKYKQQNHREDF